MPREIEMEKGETGFESMLVDFFRCLSEFYISFKSPRLHYPVSERDPI